MKTKQICETSSIFDMLAVQRCTSAILRFTFLRSSAENTALATTNWGWVIRSAAQHLEDLRIKNATPLTKRALAPLISSNHVSSCICNTSEIVRLPWQMCLLQTCFKCPTPANVFEQCTKPWVFANYFGGGAKYLAPVTRDKFWTLKHGPSMS